MPISILSKSIYKKKKFMEGSVNFQQEEKITRIGNLICWGSKQILWSGAGLCELAHTSPVTLNYFYFAKYFLTESPVQGKEDRRRIGLGCHPLNNI